MWEVGTRRCVNMLYFDVELLAVAFFERSVARLCVVDRSERIFGYDAMKRKHAVI